jgi:hypothetical protein
MKTVLIKILLLSSLLCLLPFLAFAQEQSDGGIAAVPNRPTASSTAETVLPGVFEFEYGFEAANAHQDINGLLKFGLSKNLELRFANNPFQRDDATPGGGDSSLGLKYRFVSQSRKFLTISAVYAATVPTGTNGLGEGSYGHFVSALVSKDLGKHHFDFNEGIQFIGRSGSPGFDHSYFTALAYSHPITTKWGWTAELSGFSRLNAATPASVSVLGGATYNISPRLVLDAGLYGSPYGNLPRVTFFGGVTYAITDFYHRDHHLSAKHLQQ